MDVDVPKVRADMDKLIREIEASIFRWKVWAALVSFWLAVLTGAIVYVGMR